MSAIEQALAYDDSDDDSDDDADTASDVEYEEIDLDRAPRVSEGVSAESSSAATSPLGTGAQQLGFPSGKLTLQMAALVRAYLAANQPGFAAAASTGADSRGSSSSITSCTASGMEWQEAPHAVTGLPHAHRSVQQAERVDGRHPLSASTINANNRVLAKQTNRLPAAAQHAPAKFLGPLYSSSTL